MKKIGIITHYYLSGNYGGNLQAYALATYLNNLHDVTAEQICYSFLWKPQSIIKHENSRTTRSHIKLLVLHPVVFLKKLIVHIKNKCSPSRIRNRIEDYANKKLSKKFAQREAAIKDFNQNIVPHSQVVFENDNIDDCDSLYDIFITGSDQVWSSCSDAFILKFAKSKEKISYAASIARQEISDEHKNYLKENLKDYKAISVRDDTDKKIISALTDKKVDIVLDPAFLLSRQDWEKIAFPRRMYPEKYVFCYFLGDNKNYKKTVKQFAADRKLKIVIIPHYKDNLNKFVFNDLFYGDFKPFRASPADFISLIRDAEYVFTDSFHAVVFSIIYHKQFFAFDRVSMYGSMNSRIINLLTKFHLYERFCYGNEKGKCEYLNGLCDIDFSFCEGILNIEKERAQRFLSDSLS